MSGRGRCASALCAASLWFGLPAAAAERPASAEALLRRLDEVWKARDTAGYLSLWRFSDASSELNERLVAQELASADEIQLDINWPQSPMTASRALRVFVRSFAVSEPRARVGQGFLVLERHPDGWAIVGREDTGDVQGLVHLSLDPQGLRAAGLTLQLPDFELAMISGSLFTPPASLGPTVLVFVGEGRVRFRPRVPTEQEQLRQFCGKRELVDGVKAAFIRIHPADLHKVLVPAKLEPDPSAEKRERAARRFYDAHVSQAFVLDTNLPRSPWWLLPGIGDGYVSFDSASHGNLTFTVSQGDPEQVSFFDRKNRKQIARYPLEGEAVSYDEGADDSVDLLHHDLTVRFEPERNVLLASDAIRLRFNQPLTTLRLKLADSYKVQSVTTAKGDDLLFFRVRHQDTLMVALGPNSGFLGELTVVVRYVGAQRPGPIESEVLQTPEPSVQYAEDAAVFMEDVKVYTNREAWYPQAMSDDYATARLAIDVPEDSYAVAGGVRVASRSEGGRRQIEYRLDQPGKYFTIAVGRLQEAGARSAGKVSLTAYGVARTKSDAAEHLARAEEILGFYESIFGPCPYPSLNLVLIEAEAPGGHSPPGMVVLARRPLLLRRALRDDPANFTDIPWFFLAHELAHQWWGHGVGGQNYHERWLSEGMAHYAAALWTRQAHGEKAFGEVLERMERWALRKADQGPISLGYRLGHIKNDAQIYRAIVYDKGAYVLHMLSGLVGSERFLEALRDVQTAFRFRKAGTGDLRRALEEVGGRDLSAYFKAWVFDTAIPRVTATHRFEALPAGYRVSVDVVAQGLPGPVPLRIDVAHERGTVSRVVMLPAEGGTFVVETATRPKKLDLNGDGGLLMRLGKS